MQARFSSRRTWLGAVALHLAATTLLAATLIAQGTDELATRYRAAVDDARAVEAAEVFGGLQAVTADEPGLVWQGDPGASPVLAVTWTSWSGYDASVGETTTLGREVWVTLVPSVREFCRREPGAGRWEQLLGLPTGTGKDRFVELWVDPADLFRPCPDPEIDDRVCEVDFREGVDDAHREWIESLQASSYGEGGYPWTRLGYTYDWGGDDEVGLSELVARAGAEVKVHRVYSNDVYCGGDGGGDGGSGAGGGGAGR